MALSNAANKVRPQSKDGNASRINMPLGIYLGIIKDNKDDRGMGRLKVWIPEFKSSADDASSWVTVGYASPFAGATNPHATGSNPKSSKDTQKAYGFWFVPPDVNNEVLIAFPNGDITKGVWFACLYQQANTYTVPGIPFGKTYGKTTNAETYPSAEKNKRDLDNDSSLRPRHPTLADALEDQGLTKDFLRGNSTSGAQRDSVSKVQGILTPGQQQFVMDDDVKNSYIRLRTSHGAQIFISDTFGMVYMINRAGTAWFELSADGHIDAYAEGGINMHTLGDLNLRAGKNINMECVDDFNVKAGGNMRQTIGQRIDMLAGAGMALGVNGKLTIGATGEVIVVGSTIHLNGPGADDPTQPEENALVTNTSLRTSIASRVPEHEPWQGHVNLPNPGLSSLTRSAQLSSDPALDHQFPTDPNASTTPLNVSDVKPSPNVDNTTMTDVSAMHISQNGVDFILGQEAFRPIDYWDYRYNSIGFGHLQQPGVPHDTAGEFENGKTYDQAYNKFLQDVKYFEKEMARRFKGVKFTQPQYDALISVAYNMGAGGMSGLKLNGKSIITLATEKDYKSMGNAISACPHENARRVKEAQIFLTGNYPKGNTRQQLELEGFKAIKRAINNNKAQTKGEQIGAGRWKPVFGAPTEVQKRQWQNVPKPAGFVP